MKQVNKQPSKWQLRKQQIERVWKEHPEAMIQLIGGALIFGGTIISVGAKVAMSDFGKETFYITDGDDVYSIQANKEKSLG